MIDDGDQPPAAVPQSGPAAAPVPGPAAPADQVAGAEAAPGAAPAAALRPPATIDRAAVAEFYRQAHGRSSAILNQVLTSQAMPLLCECHAYVDGPPSVAQRAEGSSRGARTPNGQNGI